MSGFMSTLVTFAYCSAELW